MRHEALEKVVKVREIEDGDRSRESNNSGCFDAAAWEMITGLIYQEYRAKKNSCDLRIVMSELHTSTAPSR